MLLGDVTDADFLAGVVLPVLEELDGLRFLELELEDFSSLLAVGAMIFSFFLKVKQKGYKELILSHNINRDSS